jgi:hypothetical protein
VHGGEMYLVLDTMRLLYSVLLLLQTLTTFAAPERISKLPTYFGYLDVTKPPYNVRAEGKTDCTAAIQCVRNVEHRIYLPAIAYLVSDIIAANHEQ